MPKIIEYLFSPLRATKNLIFIFVDGRSSRNLTELSMILTFGD